MLRFHTVLFDLDGTLLDSVDLIVDSYRHAFRTHGLPSRTREEILAGMGTPLRSVFGTITSDGDEIDRWIATYREYNLVHHDGRVSAYPGVVAMIRAIEAAGCVLGLVTSKNHGGALRGLKAIGLEDAMTIVIGADDVTQPKPDPEPVHLALERLGASAATCLFVGDSRHDMFCGKAAGVATAGITWGPFDRAHLEPSCPDYYCATPDELLALIGVAPNRPVAE
jgi:pyrophosphatase PpaX